MGILLTAFGNSTTGCNYQTGDVTGDRAVDADDLGILLAAFGEPCDSCSGAGAFSMMSEGSTTPWIITSLGYSSVEAFMAAFVEFDAADQQAMVDLMLELLE